MQSRYDDNNLPTVSGGKDGNPPDRYIAVSLTGNMQADLDSINHFGDEGYRIAAAFESFVLMGNYKENK